MIAALLFALITNAFATPLRPPDELTLRATLRFQEIDRKLYIEPVLAVLGDSHCLHSIPAERPPTVVKLCRLLDLFAKKKLLENQLSSQELLTLQNSWSLLDLKASAWNLTSIFSDPNEGAEILVSYLETIAKLSANAEDFVQLVRKLNPGRAQALDELILPLLIADLRSPFLPTTAQEFFKTLKCLSPACQQMQSQAVYELSQLLAEDVRRRQLAIQTDLTKKKAMLNTDTRSKLSFVLEFAQSAENFMSRRTTRSSFKRTIATLLSRNADLSNESKLETILDVVRFNELRKLVGAPNILENPSFQIERPDDLHILVEQTQNSINQVLTNLELALTQETSL